jgi:hypothetical protein
LAGSLLALGVIAVAPGNSFRQAYFPPHPGGLEILWISFIGVIKTVGRALVSFPGNLGLLSLWLFSLWLGRDSAIEVTHEEQPSRRRLEIAWVAIPVITFLLTLAYYTPAAYGMSMISPGRSRIIPLYFFSLALVGRGIVSGVLSRVSPKLVRVIPSDKAAFSRRLFSLSVLTALIFCSLAIGQLVQSYPLYRQFSTAWTAREQQILNAQSIGLKMVDIPFLPQPAGVDRISSDPGNWINQCMAEYYGIAIQSSISPFLDP